MVTNVTSLTGSGLRDWFIQRITAVLLAAYTFFLLGYCMLHTPLTYAVWAGLFHATCMRIFTVLALLSMLYHTWVGMWTVLGDYVKCPVLRGTLQVLVVFSLLTYVVWGASILWGA